MLPSPPPPHLPSFLMQLQALILMQRLNMLVAGLVSCSLSAAPLLSMPMAIFNFYYDMLCYPTPQVHTMEA
ncbi:hypothetical protein DFJ58DRAFT_821783, partial [Suillus subalutaceus]|uniref:uncharacterized protein n=1 Tax=Suillus subalutaceus TaxID=48586 RepID=UPI001B883069